MILLLLAGCLDELLESPYVLATGLGEVRSIAPGLDGRLLAATSTGLYAIDGEGKAERVGEPAVAVSVHPGRTYSLDEKGVSWWSPDYNDSGGIVGEPPPSEVDLLAGYDELATLQRRGLVLWPLDKKSIPRDVAVPESRAVALGPPSTYLVVTPTTLYTVSAEDVATPLVTGLTDARAAATDANGRVYVAQGAPTELWRVEPVPGGPARLVSVAKYLGDVRDLHFGIGGLLPRENLYIANGAGSVDYVRPP